MMLLDLSGRYYDFADAGTLRSFTIPDDRERVTAVDANRIGTRAEMSSWRNTWRRTTRLTSENGSEQEAFRWHKFDYSGLTITRSVSTIAAGT